VEKEILIFSLFGFALLSPLIARALRMPVPVGELMLGLSLGALIRGELPLGVALLAHLGFLLLMFMAGLEVNFDLLRKTPPRALFVFLTYSASIPPAGILLSFLLGFSPVVGLLLSLISVGLLLAVLRDLPLGETFKQRVLVIGAVGEALSLFILSFLHAFHHIEGRPSGVINEFLKITLFFFAFFTVFWAVRLVLWWFPELVRVFAGEDKNALNIRLSLFLAFGGALSAKSAGIEDALGSFLAGIVVAYFVRKKESLEEALSAVGYGFLVPLFFLKTGMELPVGTLRSFVILDVLALSLIVFLARFLPSLLLLPAGFSLKECAQLSLLLSFPFTLQVVGTELAHLSGLITEQEALRLYLSAIFCSLFFPWLGKVLGR